jgi:hypothetical protein
MTTSSSADKPAPFFVVQSGVVAWEDPAPVADWTSKTITVCAPRLSSLSGILWTLARGQESEVVRVFRWHVGAIAPGLSQLQQRRLISSMEKDPSGFARTIVELGAATICMASELIQTGAVDLQYLSSYRTTAMLATLGDVESTAALCRSLCGAIGELGGGGLALLRTMSPTWRVLRVLELESHSVVQLICSLEAAESADRNLVEQGVRRVLDLKSVPDEVASWSS